MPEAYLQQATLNGLNSAYDAIVTTLIVALEDTSMDDFHAHLLAFEMHLDRQAAVIGAATSVTNVATHNFNSCSSLRGRSYCGRGHDRFGSRLPSPN